MSTRTDKIDLIMTINNAQSAKTLQDMDNRARDLRRALSKMEVGSEDFKKAAKALQELDTKIKGIKSSMQAARQEATGLSGIFQKAFGVAGGLAIFDAIKSGIGSLVQFGREALAEADAQLAADAQIKTAIQSTAGVAGRSLSDLKQQAEELQKVTLFSDDQTEGAQALLLTFTNIRGEIFDNTIPIIQDMSTALKQDLSSSSIQVGKALNDPLNGLKALSRVGVTFDAGQKKLIKTFVESGQVAKAQTVILKELEKEFGGSARAAFGAANPVSQLKNVFGELKETVGGVVVSLLKGLAPVFSNLVAVASGLANALDYVFNASARTAKAQETLVTQTQKTQAAFNSEIEVLAKGNFSQEERARLIKEINSKYKDYLPNLISEKASIDDIRVAQEAANKVFAQKILFLAFEEKLTEVTKAGAQATNDAFEAEKRRQQLLQKSDFQDNSGLEQLNKTQVALSESLRAGAVQVVKDTPKQVAEIKKVYGALAEELGTTLDDLTKKFSTSPESAKGDGGPIGKSKKEADAAAGSLAFLRKQISDVQKEIEVTPGQSKALEPLIQQLNVAEAALKALEERIARLKNPQVEALPSPEEIAAQLGTDSSRPQTPGATDADRLAILEFNDFVLEEGKLTAEELAAFQKSLTEQKTPEEIEAAKKKEKEKQAAIKDTAISSAQSVAGAFVQIRQNAIKEETDAALSALDEEFAEKRRKAGDNQQALARIQKEYDAKKARIEKEAAEKRKKTALVEAAIAGALAVVKALPNVFAAVAAGVAAAAQIAVIASQKFDRGGYTGPGAGIAPDNTGHRPVGVVHANEWVSPPWMTTHPVWGPQVAALESIRRRGFADGGFTTTPTVSVVPLAGSSSSTAQVSMEAYMMLATEFRSFRKDISTWQSSLNVSYLAIESVGSDLSSVRVDAGI